MMIEQIFMNFPDVCRGCVGEGKVFRFDGQHYHIETCRGCNGTGKAAR